MTGSQRPTVKMLHRGFTLVEMAVVLFIVSLLVGGLLPTISSQVKQQRMTQTLKQLDDIQQALIGFAVRNVRLPCPAAPGTTGVESFAATHSAADGVCSNFYNGFLPAATLGLSPTDSQGYAIDAWGNRIRYAITNSNSYAFTATNGMMYTGISALTPNLYVCSTATGITGSACAAGKWLTPNGVGVPAVIFSTGSNGVTGGAGSDENANLDNNQTFVSHVPAPSSAANGEFDDLVTWLSPNVLINRMVAAGKLP